MSLRATFGFSLFGLFVLPFGCKPPAPTKAVSTVEPLAPRDYEKLARDLYRDEPDYERRWPIEFRVRTLEGLVQDLERAAADLGGQMGAPFFAEPTELAW